MCSLLLFCRFAKCFVTMVVCIVVRSVFMFCSVTVSRFVIVFVVYLVFLMGFVS